MVEHLIKQTGKGLSMDIPGIVMSIIGIKKLKYDTTYIFIYFYYKNPFLFLYKMLTYPKRR